MVQHDGQAGSDGPVNARHLAGPPSSHTSPNHGPATSRGNIKGQDASSSGEHQAPPSLGSKDPSMDGQDRILQDAGNFKSMSMGSGTGNIVKIKGGRMVSGRKSLTPIGVDGEDIISTREQEEAVRAASAGQMDQRLSWLENRTRMAMGMSVVDAIKRYGIQTSTPESARSHCMPALRTVYLMCGTCISPSFSVPSFPSLSSCIQSFPVSDSGVPPPQPPLFSSSSSPPPPPVPSSSLFQ
jgi:hypothetical protein